MANNRNTYQQEHTVSIKRDSLLDMAINPYLGKKDMRVMLLLLTQLDGWTPPKNRVAQDPLNFKKLDLNSMSNTLEIPKSKIKVILSDLEELGYIEEGSNDTVSHGYRFKF